MTGRLIRGNLDTFRSSRRNMGECNRIRETVVHLMHFLMFGLESEFLHRDQGIFKHLLSTQCLQRVRHYVLKGGRHPCVLPEQPLSAAGKWTRELEECFESK